MTANQLGHVLSIGLQVLGLWWLVHQVVSMARQHRYGWSVFSAFAALVWLAGMVVVILSE